MVRAMHNHNEDRASSRALGCLFARTFILSGHK